MDAIQIAKQRTNDFLGPAAAVTDSRGLGRVDEGERSIRGMEATLQSTPSTTIFLAAETEGIFNRLLPLIPHHVRSLCPMLVAVTSLDCPLAP